MQFKQGDRNAKMGANEDNHIEQFNVSLFRLSTLTKATEGLCLHRDGISDVRHFYEGLSRAVTASHCNQIAVLPPYMKLCTTKTIREQSTPKASPIFVSMIDVFLDAISRAIYEFLHNKKSISSRKSTKAAL